MTFELIVRLVFALGAVGCALAFRQPDATAAIPAACAYSVFAMGAFGLAKLGRFKAGAAGFAAVLDALFIAACLASAGLIDRYGFVVLAPMMWATGRYGTDPAALAPIVAATVMVCGNFLGKNGFDIPTMLHTLGILVVGLMTNQKKIVVKETEIPVEVTREIPVESMESLRMRESFTSLRGHLHELEQSTKRDRLGMKLWAAVHGTDESPLSALSNKIRDEALVEGMVLYRLDKETRRLVVVATSGKVPSQARDASLGVAKGLSEAQMCDRLDRQVSELRDPDRAIKCGTLILKDSGKPCGCIALFEPDAPALSAAIDLIKPAREHIGGLLAQTVKKADETRRLREAEILYGVASVAIGAESRQSLISRTLRELGDLLTVDHLAAHLVDENDSTVISTIGAKQTIMPLLSFAYGAGVSGWQATGTPEVVIPDALEDPRVDRTAALKARIGSLAVLPISDGAEAIGFVTASTHRSGGIDTAQAETLRAVVSELGQAIARQHGAAATRGVMTPPEFFATVRESGAGHFVYIDVVNRDQMTTEFGSPAVEAALRRITHRLRSRLPSGGGLCRREEGDFCCFLPGLADEAAQSWANDSAAAINGLRPTTPDGRQRIPLFARAKVAPFRPQNRQLSTEVPA